MKSLQMTQYGDISDSLCFASLAKPEPSAREVLIRAHAASINPIDLKVLRGDFKAIKKVRFPMGIGRDVSGTVEAVGPEVTAFKPGDAVYSRVGEEFHVGTLAEYAIADMDHVARMPAKLGFHGAASLPLAGLTAWQSLIDAAGLQAGEKVLIHAGSGGVGSLAIQIAKMIGAEVVTTTSTRNVELVKSFGADHVVDYKKENYLEVAGNFDVVFDTLGGETTLEAFRVLKPGGRVVSVSGELDELTMQDLGLPWVIRKVLAFKARKITQAAREKNASYRMVLMSSSGQQLGEIADAVEKGDIRPVIDRVFALDDSLEAFKHLQTGRARGKVVVEVIGD